MDTRPIENKLAKHLGYKRLDDSLSIKFRKIYKDNIPSFLSILGDNKILCTVNGTKFINRYNRIVVGDYGAFIEFEYNDLIAKLIIAPGQEYRVYDKKYKDNVKYLWLTVDDGSNIKVYYQKKTVSYADYKPRKLYVSVHEVKEVE